MAVYHLKASFGSRSGGHSARAKSDYIEREGRYEKDGEELEYKEHWNMPEWAEDDPGEYWEAADEHERANGRLYSEVPVRASQGARRGRAAGAYRRVRRTGVLQGAAALYAGHPPGRGERRKSPRAPDVLGAGP